MKKHTILILLLIILVISGSVNVLLYNKSKQIEGYETAADTALSYFISEYRIEPIHRSLTQSLSEEKLYFGEPGRFNNSYRSDLQKLSIVHRQLTLLYGPINSYEEYTDISSIGTNNLFIMLVDFSMFFEYLEELNFDSMARDSEGQYIDLSKLDEEIIDGVKIIAEITGDLESIRSSSYEDKAGNDKQALIDFMKKSAAYFNTEDVQKKIVVVQNLNKKLFSQLD